MRPYPRPSSATKEDCASSPLRTSSKKKVGRASGRRCAEACPSLQGLSSPRRVFDTGECSIHDRRICDKMPMSHPLFPIVYCVELY